MKLFSALLLSSAVYSGVDAYISGGYELPDQMADYWVWNRTEIITREQAREQVYKSRFQNGSDHYDQ